MNIVISAGGTGGHIYPAIAIINKFKEKDKKTNILLNLKTKFQIVNLLVAHI